MASYQLRGKTYRAQVYSHGRRTSKSFMDIASAREWAEAVEDQLDSEDGRPPRWTTPPPPDAHDALVGMVEDRDSLLFEADEILNRARFKPSCGIYFLIKDDEIVYVGQAIDVHGRVAQHRLMWKDFDSYTYIACQPAHLMAIEMHYIKKFQPILNRAGNPRWQASENAE